MNTNQLKKLTPYPDINNILVDWVEGVKNTLHDNVVGLYLSGSLTYGDFVPERSDIDLQAVVRKPLTEEELKSIELLHKEIDARYPAWAKRTECTYVPVELMKEILPPKTPRPWWGFDNLYAAALAGNEWIINHYLLSKYGVALHGADFNSLIPCIDIRQVQKASARDLFKEWEPKINDTEWLSNSHYQSYVVLNLFRILYTVIGGEPRSKNVAARWAKTAYPQWRDLIEEAERWEYGTAMKRNEQVIAFIKFAIEKVNETNLLV
jgi:predicted nucleotidyltransferase